MENNFINFNSLINLFLFLPDTWIENLITLQIFFIVNSSQLIKTFKSFKLNNLLRTEINNKLPNISKVVFFTIQYSGKDKKKYLNDFKQNKLYSTYKDIFNEEIVKKISE